MHQHLSEGDWIVSCGRKSGGYEIILVDDGSTDDTPIIIEEYEKKYDFIRAYKKSNGGVSSARNLGLQHANGEYITFFDIDDVVEDGYYQSSLEVVENMI